LVFGLVVVTSRAVYFVDKAPRRDGVRGRPKNLPPNGGGGSNPGTAAIRSSWGPFSFKTKIKTLISSL